MRIVNYLMIFSTVSLSINGMEIENSALGNTRFVDSPHKRDREEDQKTEPNKKLKIGCKEYKEYIKQIKEITDLLLESCQIPDKEKVIQIMEAVSSLDVDETSGKKPNITGGIGDGNDIEEVKSGKVLYDNVTEPSYCNLTVLNNGHANPGHSEAIAHWLNQKEEERGLIVYPPYKRRRTQVNFIAPEKFKEKFWELIKDLGKKPPMGDWECFVFFDYGKIELNDEKRSLSINYGQNEPGIIINHFNPSAQPSNYNDGYEFTDRYFYAFNNCAVGKKFPDEKEQQKFCVEFVKKLIKKFIQ